MVGLSKLLAKTLHKSAGTISQEADIWHLIAYTRENFLWHCNITLHFHGSFVSSCFLLLHVYWSKYFCVCWCRDAEIIYKQKYQGKHHLLATDGMELCWDASPKGKPTSKEFNRGSFSPCKWDANQVTLNADSWYL